MADINTHPDYRNSNKPHVRSGLLAQNQPRINQPSSAVVVSVDANDNRTTTTTTGSSKIGMFRMQSSQLPKPQFALKTAVDVKSAKTVANNNRKATSSNEESSSKEGSVTGDSGVGSGYNGETVELLDGSPTFGMRRIRAQRRQLDMVVSGKNFDIIDLDEYHHIEHTIELPRLPSAFYNTGFVRDRRIEYERQLDNRRKISVTSSEGYSDDYTDEERGKFIKPPLLQETHAASSSDEPDWLHAGEAMAEEFSCSFSSSDESKDKIPAVKPTNLPLPNKPPGEIVLTIEDPKFAAVAAACNTSTLLEDETSPVDSLLCSYSETEEYIKQKLANDLKKCAIMETSTSKDANEKPVLSPASPGTPTNASNSLSLSDGKDYFDDEIADQPELVFDDNVNTVSSECENTPTIQITPKFKRKPPKAIEGSPLLLRRRNLLNNRTPSVDTLSPCESIASDDLMMDYEQSQSSGLDETLER